MIDVLKNEESKRKHLLVGVNLLRGEYVELKKKVERAELVAQGELGRLESKGLELGNIIKSSREIAVKMTQQVNMEEILIKKVRGANAGSMTVTTGVEQKACVPHSLRVPNTRKNRRHHSRRNVENKIQQLTTKNTNSTKTPHSTSLVDSL